MKQVCVLGDGGVFGDGAVPGWVDTVARTEAAEAAAGSGLSLFNLGIPGETTEALAARWRSEIDRRLGPPRKDRSTVLVFCFGFDDMADVDDAGIRLPLFQSVAVAETLIAEAQTLWPLLWIGPMPAPPGARSAAWRGQRVRVQAERLDALNTAYRSVASTLGVPYLDLHQALTRDDAWKAAQRMAKGLIPGTPGQDRIARTVMDWPAWRQWIDGSKASANTAPLVPPPAPPDQFRTFAVINQGLC